MGGAGTSVLPPDDVEDDPPVDGEDGAHPPVLPVGPPGFPLLPVEPPVPPLFEELDEEEMEDADELEPVELGPPGSLPDENSLPDDEELLLDDPPEELDDEEDDDDELPELPPVELVPSVLVELVAPVAALTPPVMVDEMMSVPPPVLPL